MPTLLTLCALLAAPIQDDAPVPTLPAAPVSVPIDLSTGHPIVSVRIDGRGPFPMIFDTGAAGIVLDADLARELGLEKVGTTRIGDPSNPEANAVDVVRVTSMAIGDASWGECEAVAWERPAALQRQTSRGIIGLPLIEHCLFTLDYAGGVIVFEHGELPEPDGERVVTLTRDPFGILVFPIEVAGQRVECHLDSGNPSAILLPGALRTSLTLVPGTERSGRGMRASGPVEFVSGKLEGRVRAGSLVFDGPEVRFDQSMKTANLGRSLLERCALTLDLAAHRMRLRPYDAEELAAVAAARPAAPTRRLGVGFRPTDAGLEVVQVEPDSAAARAGLAVGDLLLAVDGQAVGRNDDGPLRTALAGAAAIRLSVQRAGERIELVVPAQ